MVDKTHFFFNNPKYVFSHFIIQSEGKWMVFEKMKQGRKSIPIGVIATGTPQGIGNTKEEAIADSGAKHYMVKEVDVDEHLQNRLR